MRALIFLGKELALSNWNFLKQTIEKDDFIIDCRNQSAYEESTIKGAYYFPFIKKAFGSDTESQKKMYTPLKAILGLINDSNKSRVIVFDEGMGMFSARMVYLLRAIGFKESYMLALKWPFDGATEPGNQLVDVQPTDPADYPEPFSGIGRHFMIKKGLSLPANFLSNDYRAFLLCQREQLCCMITMAQDRAYALSCLKKLDTKMF